MKNRMYKVYHIRPVGQTDTSKFYVGITKNSLEFRLLQHMTSKRPVGSILRDLGKDAVEIVCLHHVGKEEAMRLEAEYRPLMNIGWNVRAGGDTRTVICSGCGNHLPKRATGAKCASCNDTRFAKGSTPANAGTGMKAVLLSPEGEHVTFHTLHQFCNEHGLVPANVRKVIKGDRKHTKGWTLVSTEG